MVFYSKFSKDFRTIRFNTEPIEASQIFCLIEEFATDIYISGGVKPKDPFSVGK